MTRREKIFLPLAFLLLTGLNLGLAPERAFADDGHSHDEAYIPGLMFGWDEPSSEVFARDFGRDANLPGFYFGAHMGYQWLDGQPKEVFVEGGFASTIQLGVSWENWYVVSDTQLNSLGNRLGADSTLQVATGALVGRRFHFSPAWALTLGAGWHYNWVSVCPHDTGDEYAGCGDADYVDYFKPEGHSFNVDIGISWVWLRGSDATFRGRNEMHSTLRLATLSLDNEPAQRTIEGLSIIWTLGTSFDLALDL